MRNSIAIRVSILVLLFLLTQNDLCLNNLYSGFNILPINPFHTEIVYLILVLNFLLTEPKLILLQQISHTSYSQH